LNSLLKRLVICIKVKMFATFTSILSPALKEKLGIGPKPSPPPGTCATPKRPISVPNNKTLKPLSPALQTEVQSPGFSSRVISQVKEGSKPKLSDPGLSPLSMSVSSRYSRVGQLPVVTLTKKPLPRLTPKNSEKFCRREGRAPVMMKLAPQEPYSPFKRYSGSTERGGSGSRGREGQGGSTDPRQVIAVLAELSGKRTRRPSDDLSITGSKRARRDSSSSLGSSLSMEMPPLFQNGVVGQSTSHLVSREADLSLGSLLSRNQSLFGHSPLSQHHSHSLPPTSMSHHHTVSTADAQSQTITHKPKTSSDQALSLEIQASLSSSRCLLKRTRDELEEDSEDEENIPTPKATNVLRSPDKDKDIAYKKRRQSSESSCKSNNSTLTEIQIKNASPEVSKNDGKIVVASPAEILGTPAPKKRRTAQIIGEKELNGERELQRKRLGKMLNIFPDQKALSPESRKSNEDPKDLNDAAIPISKAGGFAFQLGEKFDSSQNKSSVQDSLPFTLGTKSNELDKAASSVTVAVSSQESTTTTSTPMSFGNITVPSTASAGLTSVTKVNTSAGVKSPSKPSSVTFNLGDSNKEAGKATMSSGFIVSEPNKVLGILAQSKPKDSCVTSTVSSSTPMFSFGGSGPVEKIGMIEKGPTTSVSGKLTTNDSTLSASTVVSTTPQLAFTFGTSKSEETQKSLPAPSFNFGSSIISTTPSSVALSSATTNPSFGATSDAAGSKPFTFGIQSISKTETAPASAPAPSKGLFTFGATVSSASNSVPSFGSNIGAKTVATSAAGPFMFGQTSSAASTTSSVSSGLFTFDASKTGTTTSSSGFGSSASITTAPSFGTVPTTSASSQNSTFASIPATSTSSQPFSFGATPAKTTVSSTFSFGSVNPPVTSSSLFTFGKTASEPSKPFAFGNSNQNTASTNPFGSNTPSFGTAVTSTSGFGSTSSNAFGGSTATSASNTFGGTSVTKSASTGNVFSFGKSSTAQPAAAPSPFTFGASNPSKPPVASATVTPFQFGAPSSSPPKPTFNFGGSSSSSTPAFGATTPAPFGTPAAAVSPTFGAPQNNSSTQPPGVFSFGATSTPAPGATAPTSNTGFNFSAATQNPSGVFNFGGSTQPSNPQVTSPFGAPVNPAPAFGAPSTNFGAAPPSFGGSSGNFGTAPGAAPAGGNMFSIGTGGQQTRSSTSQRRIATARRTRKQ